MTALIVFFRSLAAEYATEMFLLAMGTCLFLAWVFGRYGYLTADIKEIKFEIKDLRKRIDHLFTVIPTATAPGSPLHLTDLGKRIAQEINAQSILEAHRKTWEEKLKQVTPFDASNIESAAIDLVNNKLSLTKEEDNILRGSAKNANLSFENVLTILAVMMRDDVLEGKSSN